MNTSQSCKHPVRCRLPQHGFTLMELLVSMFIAAVLAATLFGSLRVAFLARDSAQRAVEAGRDAESVMEFLRNDLQCALPPRGQFAVSFVGTSSQDNRGNDADDLIFYTTASSPLHPGGANGEIKQIELTSYQPGNSTDHVLARRTLNNLLAPQPENPDEEVLCRHVYGLNFRYYDGTTWQETWDTTQSGSAQAGLLPQAIEVTLSLEASARNVDGKPRITRYIRIFQFPCSGQSSDATTGGAQ